MTAVTAPLKAAAAKLRGSITKSRSGSSAIFRHGQNSPPQTTPHASDGATLSEYASNSSLQSGAREPAEWQQAAWEPDGATFVFLRALVICLIR